MKMICKQCGQMFDLTDSEMQFYQEKGLHLPKRCEICRAKNKSAKISHVSKNVYIADTRSKKFAILSAFVILGLILSAILISKLISPDKNPSQITAEVESVSTMIETEPPIKSVTQEITEPTTQKATESETQKMTEPEKEVTYYLNTYRMKFHRPDCPSVQQMNAHNRQAFYGTREETVHAGYSPCNNCKP